MFGCGWEGRSENNAQNYIVSLVFLYRESNIDVRTLIKIHKNRLSIQVRRRKGWEDGRMGGLG